MCLELSEAGFKNQVFHPMDRKERPAFQVTV